MTRRSFATRRERRASRRICRPCERGRFIEFPRAVRHYCCSHYCSMIQSREYVNAEVGLSHAAPACSSRASTSRASPATISMPLSGSLTAGPQRCFLNSSQVSRGGLSTPANTSSHHRRRLTLAACASVQSLNAPGGRTRRNRPSFINASAARSPAGSASVEAYHAGAARARRGCRVRLMRCPVVTTEAKPSSSCPSRARRIHLPPRSRVDPSRSLSGLVKAFFVKKY